jgi:hypothetical protein
LKKFIAPIIAVLALFLSSCSQVDSAATIGDEKITIAALQDQVDLILEEREGIDTTQMSLQSGEELTRSQLSYMISNLIINQVAQEEKIEIEQAEIDAYKIEIYANIGGEENLPNVLVSAAIPSTSLDNVLRRDLILRKITDGAIAAGVSEAEVNDLIQEIVTKKAAALKVEINPRYGIWEAAHLTVVAAEPAGDAVNDK